jgi:hypothetical protein
VQDKDSSAAPVDDDGDVPSGLGLALQFVVDLLKDAKRGEAFLKKALDAQKVLAAGRPFTSAV